jgi:hypothetical protein
LARSVIPGTTSLAAGFFIMGTIIAAIAGIMTLVPIGIL